MVTSETGMVTVPSNSSSDSECAATNDNHKPCRLLWLRLPLCVCACDAGRR